MYVLVALCVLLSSVAFAPREPSYRLGKSAYGDPFPSGVGMWHVERNHVKILKNRADRGRTTPSVVHFLPSSHEVLVGNAAIAREYDPPGNTVRAIKRLMGQRFDSRAVQLASKFATHSIVATVQGNAAVQVQRGGDGAEVMI